ncbi:MAG: HD domain-containing protein [Clostridia bacterium]|nr:HD domain-containing protein [Clostridia bacterium]MBQ9854942.1 HD domain-containing protein [Clostridia bacterium]
MHGLHVNLSSGNTSDKAQDINLLARRPGMEIMHQQIDKGATVWLAPATDPDTFEFFYVLSGSLNLMLPEGSVVLNAGASFHVDWLEGNVSIESLSDTKLLYVTNKPFFDDLSVFEDKLRELNRQIDEKDHYTFHHSTNVLKYSIEIAKHLSSEEGAIDALATASLFHDVGKCYVPDEILQKKGRLTDEEYDIIKRHPADSAKLLEPRFGKRVAEIAESHHERLNGSGYPRGLKGDEISIEGKIIAVIDSFDTMTSRRVYTVKPKTFLEAAEELCSLPHLYDKDVCRVLMELVKSGEIAPDPNDQYLK